MSTHTHTVGCAVKMVTTNDGTWTTQSAEYACQDRPALVVDYHAGTPEAQTSYANQRQLAVRALGPLAECAHGARLIDGCQVCRWSRSVLITAVVA